MKESWMAEACVDRGAWRNGAVQNSRRWTLASRLLFFVCFKYLNAQFY
jgi:hypothetical protein